MTIKYTKPLSFNLADKDKIPYSKIIFITFIERLFSHSVLRSFLIIVTSVVFLTTLLAACRSEDEAPEVIRPVKSTIVGGAHSTTLRTFPAKVSAFKEAKLAFQVPGEMIKRPITEGMAVSKGQLLAKLDPNDYEHNVAEAQAKYDLALSLYRRSASLVKEGHISQAEFDTKISELKVAEAALKKAKRDLYNTNLYAPFDGVISKTFVENFENVKAKQVIANINYIGKLDVKFDVPENVIVRLKDDSRAHAYAVFEAIPERRFPLCLKEFASEADPDTQTYSVTMTMSAPKNYNILPGMTAEVEAELPDYLGGNGDFYTLPSGAVFHDTDNKPAVWVVDPKTNRVRKVNVKVSRLAGDKIRVTEGLKPGDRVVIAGASFIHDGEHVRVVDDKSKRK